MSIDEIKKKIKTYIEEEENDIVHVYDDLSKEEKANSLKIIEKLKENNYSKIDIIIEKEELAIVDRYELDDYICDIFENIIYRTSTYEYDFLFDNNEYVLNKDYSKHS